MLKRLQVKYKLHNSVNTLFVFFILFILSGCGGGMGTAGSGEVSGYDTGEFIEGGTGEVNGGMIPGSSNETMQTGFINLSWTASVSDAVGSPITDLGGYIIYYRKNDLISNIVSMDVGDVEYATINNLSSGTWCFAVTTYNSSGIQSNFSNFACKDI